jgi:hypothetical protein
MNRILTAICQSIAQLAKKAWRVPQTIVTGFGIWRQQDAPNLAEAERLDRIRNPSKYRGK